MIGTIIFHIVLIAILILAGFSAESPSEEEGLLVNFGMDVFGEGIIEPSPRFAEITEPAVQSADAASIPPPATGQAAQREILTQDFEESHEVERADEEQEREEEEQARREREAQAEAERVRAEEEARQRAEAEELLRREAEERERREAEERERREREEAERRRAQEISDMVGNALATARDTGRVAAGTGATDTTGTQGAATGSVDSRLRGDTSGAGRDGISFSLDGRSPQELPRPEYNIQEEGIVVVEIRVDRAGRVTDARPGVRGSTTTHPTLIRLAKEAAERARFNADPNAPATQIGTITYHFILR